MARGWAPLLLLTLLIGSGCGRPVENRAERAIAELLPRYLGPADRYTTRVSGRTDALLRGHLRGVHIDGQNVRLMPDLAIAQLSVDLTDISVDTNTRQVQKIGSATFSARLTEAAVNRYATSRRGTLRDLAIRLQSDGIAIVRARPELFGYPTLPVEVRGALYPQGDGRHLDFVPDSARVSIVPIPSFVVEHIARRLNPLVDLSDTPVPILVEEVNVGAGALTLSGTVPTEALTNLH